MGTFRSDRKSSRLSADASESSTFEAAEKAPLERRTYVAGLKAQVTILEKSL
jgi:hypothetical protein